MAEMFLVGGIRRWIRRGRREKKLVLAKNWPTIQARINHWEVLSADEDAASIGAPFQIEAGFHFTLKDEYYGGYVRSVAMGLHEAETKAKGSPSVNVRYNPANPDNVAVLAEDNVGNLPFRILPG
jgi:hypothetical protein